VIVNDLDFCGIVTKPNKTNTKLIVDADAVLSGAIPCQSFKAVSARNR